MQSLASLLAGITLVDPVWDREIKSVAIDSRAVKTGALFIAYPGFQADGRNYLEQAVAQGAVAVIREADTPGFSEQGNIPIFDVPNVQQKVSKIAARFYQHPSRHLDIIGITGTNGKTSCAYYLAQLFTTLEKPCAIIGTIGSGLIHELSHTGLTTPDAISVQAQLAHFLERDIKHVAMEVSSHALDQKRVDKVEFQTAVFTNLSQDHLDYHHSMQAYGEAKLKLFQQFGLQHAVINLDDEFSKQIESILAPTVTCYRYSLTNSKADIFAHDVEFKSNGIHANISSPWGKGKLHLSLLGQFNLANCLAVIACLCIRDFKLEDVLAALSQCHGAPGRMQLVTSTSGITFVIDYAHTPDALEQALKACKQHCQTNVWCVFGCGGDRDKEKRPLMGAIAAEYADHMVITDDNPRYENPDDIVAAIMRGIQKSGDVHVQRDREQAITFAYNQASPGDVILIAGKGHEDYQLVADKKRHFSDLETAQKLAEINPVEST